VRVRAKLGAARQPVLRFFFTESLNPPGDELHAVQVCQPLLEFEDKSQFRTGSPIQGKVSSEINSFAIEKALQFKGHSKRVGNPVEDNTNHRQAPLKRRAVDLRHIIQSAGAAPVAFALIV